MTTIHISNCPTCGHFPTQFIGDGPVVEYRAIATHHGDRDAHLTDETVSAVSDAADQLRAYGDEREAYGRATAPAEVGDGQALMQAKARAVYLEELLSRSVGYLRTCSCESDQAELGALVEKISKAQTERPRP